MPLYDCPKAKAALICNSHILPTPHSKAVSAILGFSGTFSANLLREDFASSFRL
jgi:hypothetical protein